MRVEAPAPADARAGTSHRGERLRVALGAAAAAIVLALWMLGLAHAAWLWPGQSDSAAVILAGDAMRHGNWLLHGWSLPYDTYWLLDIPLYALAVAALGITPTVMHLVPLGIYVGVVVAAVALATGGRRPAAALAAGTVTLTLLGLLGPTAALTLLHGPAHVSTTLTCLLAFAAFSRASQGWRAGYAVAFILLLLALVSDPMARAIGVAPVVVAAALYALRERAWPRARLRQAVAAATALLALVGSHFIKLAAAAAGGFAVVGGSPGLTGPASWPTKLPLFISSTLTIFGVDVGSSAWQTPLAVAHFVGLLTVAAATLYVLSRTVIGLRGTPFRSSLTPRADAIDQAEATGAADLAPTALAQDGHWLDAVLALGVAAGVAAFFLSGYASDPTSVRYLSPAFVFGAVLAGRLAGTISPARAGRAVRPAIALGVLLVAAYATTFAGVAREEIPQNPAAPLAAWLRQHGLTRGYGAYWDASIVTLYSKNLVQIRPVDEGSQGLEPYRWNSSAGWYAVERGHPATFVVFEPTAPWKGVDVTSATATFGPPAATYQVGAYEVLAWDHDLTPLLRNR